MADDDELLREGCAALLQAAGHEVILAADGNAAAAALRGATVDLIISDIEMPGMNGLQLLALAHDEYPRLPFILVTGHATLEAAVTALRRGAADFLQKPIQPAQFRHVVERALEHSRLAEENRNLAQQLESERMKSEFVAIASHEIRTPLAAIKNCLGILRAGSAGPLTPIRTASSPWPTRAWIGSRAWRRTSWTSHAWRRGAWRSPRKFWTCPTCWRKWPRNSGPLPRGNSWPSR